MAAPKKYPDESRERATRLAVEARQDPARKAGALQRIGEQLGINPETLRGWVKQAEIDADHAPGVTTAEAQRIKDLEAEVRELRRANEILKAASAFFAAELDRPHKRESPSSTNTRTAPRAGSDGVSSRSALCSPSMA